MTKEPKGKASSKKAEPKIPDALKNHPLIRTKQMADEAARNDPIIGELVAAARSGDIPNVKRLLSQGVNPNKIPPGDPNMETAVWAAVYARKPDVIRVLGEGGADLNAGSPDTPLVSALRWGDIGLARALIESGADVSRPSPVGETPLLWAIEGKHAEIVSQLLHAGADPNPPVAKHSNRHQFTPLQYAAYAAGPPILDMLLEAGATQPDLDRLLLCGAAGRGDLKEIKRLIAKGVDVNAKDSSTDTPLLYAIRYGKDKIVRFLLDNGADPNLPGGNENEREVPVVTAAMCGKLSIVQMLVEAGANPDQPFRSGPQDPGLTALDYAKGGRLKKITEYLLSLAKPSGQAKPARLPRPTGVYSFNTEDSCVLVAADVDTVANAFCLHRHAKTCDKDMLGKTVKLTKTCYAVFRIIDQPFSAIMRLNCDDVRHYPRIADAQLLSESLATRSIFVANSDTASISQYAVFDAGKLVELFDFGTARSTSNRAGAIEQFASDYGLDLTELPNLQVNKSKVFGSSLRKPKLSTIKNDLEFITSFLQSENAFAPLYPDPWGHAGQRVELTLEGLGSDDIERLDYVAV